jgi:hypothetical protein
LILLGSNAGMTVASLSPMPAIRTRLLAALVTLAASGCVGTIVGPGAAPAGDDDGATAGADAAPEPGSPDAATPPPPGSPDAAPSPPADGAPATLSCANPPAGTLFCEDFESFAPGVATDPRGRWQNETSNGSLTIDSTQARGTRALHVHTIGNGRAYAHLAPFAPPGNSFYGRAYVFVTEFPSAPAFAHFTLVEASGSSGGGVIRPIGGQFVPAPTAGKSLWGVGSDGGATGDWTDWRTTAPAEAGRWQCLEWQLAADDNQIHVWIDGVEKPELSASTTQHGGNQVDFVFPTFSSLLLGWQLYQGGTSPAEFDLWFDDVVLATSRVGCG